MNSNIFKTMAVVVTAIFTGYNVYLAQAENNAVSELLLANVEALSQNEEGGGGEAVITCSAKCSDGIGKCWTKSEPKRCVRSGSQYDYCHTDMDGGRTCAKIDGETYN